MGTIPCGGGKAGMEAPVWAVGEHQPPTETTPPDKHKPKSIELLKTEGKMAKARFEDGLVPEMNKPKVNKIELDDQPGLEVEIVPSRRPSELKTPLWLDPARFGELSKYTNIDILKAKRRGFDALARERGYTPAALTVYRELQEKLANESTEILNEVESILEEYVPHYVGSYLTS